MPITPVKDMVADAKTRIQSLSPEEARRRVEERNALLVDIRDAREIERDGAVPGAFHAPRGMLEFWVDPHSPYHKPQMAGRPLILFCASSWRSALSADTLQKMGVDDVAEIDGGFKAWESAGAPVQRTT